jgi:hypothetical protein
MNNNDERDYEEENANRILMEEDYGNDYEVPSEYEMYMEPSLRYYDELDY